MSLIKRITPSFENMFFLVLQLIVNEPKKCFQYIDHFGFGRRRQLCRYLLGGTALKAMTFVEWWSHGNGAELRRRQGDGGRGGGSGRWMYAEAAASDSDATVPLWGRVAVVHCFGGGLVLCG